MQIIPGVSLKATLLDIVGSFFPRVNFLIAGIRFRASTSPTLRTLGLFQLVFSAPRNHNHNIFGKLFDMMIVECGYWHIQATKPDTVGACASLCLCLCLCLFEPITVIGTVSNKNKEFHDWSCSNVNKIKQRYSLE